MSVCSVSASFLPTVCRGYTPCNPNFIQLGDQITIDLCLQNAAERPTANDPPYPLVTAALKASSQIEVFLMCRESECSTSSLTGITYQSFVPKPGVSAGFTLGTTANCHDAASCGLLTLGAELPLPASTSEVCIGTIQGYVSALPSGSTHGLFYTHLSTRPQDLKITDGACIPGLTGGSSGGTVARILASSYFVHSNLGGQGPDTNAPQAMRFANVGSVVDPRLGPNPVYFDLKVTTRSAYVPYDSGLNRKAGNGLFAQVNLACGQSVDLRTTITFSCATAPSCMSCDAQAGADRLTCYQAGCACYGTTVFTPSGCEGVSADSHKAGYNCPSMDVALVLPREALVSMTVYDLDMGPTGDYIERLTVPVFEHFVTPLRPFSGDAISSTVLVNRAMNTFTATATGSPADNPTNPTMLTNDQASRGIQFFFRPDDGHTDATFSVVYTGTGTCTGRNLLFAGDSALMPPPGFQKHPTPIERARAENARARNQKNARHAPQCNPMPTKPAAPPPVERRFDTDGGAYTREEFFEFYGRDDEWNQASTHPVSAQDADQALVRGASAEYGAAPAAYAYGEYKEPYGEVEQAPAPNADPDRTSYTL